MDESIGKLSNKLITEQLTHLHVNSYFMSKFYFGCRMTCMTDAQFKELRRTYEKPLAGRLGLGSKFPRNMLHSRVKSMGVVIVDPKTEITALILKIYFSHKRMNSENVKMMKIIENNSIIETGSKGESRR